MSTVVTSVDRRSPAQRAGIQAGEKLLTVNGHEIVDVLDYRFYCYDPVLELELEDERVNPKHCIVAVRGYLCGAGFPSDTALELAGMATNIYG